MPFKGDYQNALAAGQRFHRTTGPHLYWARRHRDDGVSDQGGFALGVAGKYEPDTHTRQHVLDAPEDWRRGVGRQTLSASFVQPCCHGFLEGGICNLSLMFGREFQEDITGVSRKAVLATRD